MSKKNWTTTTRSVVNLHLDAKNPRLGRETMSRAPNEIIQYLFDHDKALDIASSIATRGFFRNEPLLAVEERNQLVVVEGNRRLAALKALREPRLLDGPYQRKVERLVGKIDQSIFGSVPVVIAPNRKATDQLVAGRHIGRAVEPWQAENRASFILDKLDEGYTNDALRDDLGFTLTDIQNARQTRAIADIARCLPLEDEVRAKLDSPKPGVFSTIERVVDSTVGRKYLHIEPNPDHGFVGRTTKKEFVKGFSKLVTDAALGKITSRKLNTNEQIEKYFRDDWTKKERPEKKRGTVTPASVTSGKSTASKPRPKTVPKRAAPQRKINQTVIPKTFKVRYGADRLVEIRDELCKLKRDDFPNSGAVLLRVFFELAILDYLDRIGELDSLKKRYKGTLDLRQGIPTLRVLRKEIVKIAKDNLDHADAIRVEKAIRQDRAAPFTLDDLHSFVHQAKDLPSGRDIAQFWTRTEPLFRLMLMDEIVED